MNDAMNAILGTFVPVVAMVLWAAAAFFTAQSDNSITLLASWYAPASHAFACIAWVCLMVSSCRLRDVAIENGSINHQATVLIETGTIGLHSLALVYSRDALLLFNGAFTMWMFLCLLGIVSILKGWHPSRG